MADIKTFEGTLAVKPVPEQPGNFVSVYKPWGYPGLGRIAGSIPLGEAAAAAYKTVLAGHEIHCVQAQFLKPSLVGIPLRYEVQSLHTSSKFASRNVIVRQRQQGEKEEPEEKDDIKAVITFSFFFQASIKDKGFPRKHEHLVTPSLNTLRVVKRPIEPELDDFNGPVRLNCPEGTPYPPFNSQRLEVTKELDTNQRTYYVKLRVTSPISSPSGHILAVIFLSDMYAVETPLETKGIKFGIPARDDPTRTPTESELLQFASLNHSLRFVRLDGFDVTEGVVFENQTKWAKGRRAVAQLTIRDVRGEIIAMAEQEVS